MHRLLPSLKALQCFDAAARHLSFTGAAEELGQTQSAVSRQVAKLEAFLRRSLFRRTGAGLVLTESGEAYAREVETLLERLEEATAAAMDGAPTDAVLNVGVFPTFGTRWLIPRLSRFATRHPGVRVNLVSGTSAFDFAADGVDIAIQYGEAKAPALRSYALMDEEVVAVCAPAILRPGADHAPMDVMAYPLLRLATRPQAWRVWFDQHGLVAPPDRDLIFGSRFEHFEMMINAAIAGLGVALVPRLFVEEELATGRLAAPFSPPRRSGGGYFIVYPEAKGGRPELCDFRDWVLQQRY
ncbi:MAG: LysR family transcriptional regulator [Rhodobacterales bacterium]|nr:LysR family transcriptional regulator [Rhodobacterales bacterium]